MDRKSMELKKYLLKIVKIKKLFLEAIYEDIFFIYLRSFCTIIPHALIQSNAKTREMAQLYSS